jgi:tetratricopeptide (TPR) repeat protein
MSKSLRDIADLSAGPVLPDTQASSATDVRELLRQAPDMDPARVVELLQLDQVRRWRQGQRIPAEAYLQLFAPPAANADAAFDLVYGEYLLRKELGETPSAEEYRWRFPQYAQQLERQLALEATLGEDGLTDPDATRDLVAASPIDGDSTLSVPGHPAAPITPYLPTVPGYVILEEVGRGGMGVVYKARQTALGRVVALKIIRAGAGADATELARFLQEARAAARFQHAHIVQVYEVGTHADQPYIALEFVDGGNLADYVGGRPVPPRQAADLLAILADTMHAAHQQGIVHRDLKPANILLKKNEPGRRKEDSDLSSFTPKVADFGLAKQLPGHAERKPQESTLTHSGMVLGTPQFMAPEQASGRTREVGPLSDVYSLGAILYVTLTGRPPYLGAELDVLLQVLQGEPVPPTRLNAGVPRELETVCLKCLAKDPRRRYAGAGDLADDLRRYLRGEPVLARPIGISERAWKWAKRRPAVATLLGVSALALVVLLIGGLYTNARLRSLLDEAQAAGGRADANAKTADAQRALALEALQKLVFEVQEQLRDTPATRAMRERLLNTAVSGLRQLANSTEASAPEVSRAAAHQQLGILFAQVGRSADAQRQFEFARDISAAVLDAEPQNRQARSNLCQAYFELGQLDMNRDKVASARDLLRQAVGFAEAWQSAEPADATGRQILADGYDRLAHAQLWLRDVDGASATLDKARRHIEAWKSAAPEDRSAKYFLSSVYDKLGTLKEQSGDRAGQRDYYLKEMAITRELLASEPGSRKLQRELFVVLNNLGAIALDDGKPSEAKAYIEQSVAIIRELALADPEGLGPQLDLLNSLYNCGLLEQRAEHHAAALTWYQQALDLTERLERGGKLQNRPMYTQERKDQLRNGIAFCSLTDAVLKDIAIAKTQRPFMAADLLVYRLRVLMRQGRFPDARATVVALCALEAKDTEHLLHLAAACAISSETLAKEPRLKTEEDRCAGRGVELLRQAAAGGFKDARRLESDADLASLRRRPDFQSLVQSLKQGPH